MTNKIKATISILLISTLLIPAFSITAFADGVAQDNINANGEAENGAPGSVETGSGDTTFKVDSRMITHPTEDTEFNWITGEKGTLKENVESHRDFTEADGEAYFNSVVAFHLVGSEQHAKDPNGGGYNLDGMPKNWKMFVPKGASKELRELVKWKYTQLDNTHNGRVSSGNYPMTFFYISKEDMKNYKRQKGKAPRELKKDWDKMFPPKKNTPKPDNPKIPPNQCDIGFGNKYEKTSTSSANDTVTGPYSVMVTVYPQKPVNFSSLTPTQQQEWKRTHRVQSKGPVKTPFGKYLDSNRAKLRQLKELGKSGGVGENSNYRKAWEEFASGARKAASEPIPELSVQLDKANLEGNTRGAVFTYVEQVKNATVSTVHQQDLYTEYDCVMKTFYKEAKVKDKNGKIKKEKVPYYRTVRKPVKKNAKIDGSYAKSEVVAITADGYTPRTSYQTLTVKCNKDGFDSIVASTGSTVISETTAAQSAKSPTVQGRFASFYNSLDKSFFYSGKSCDDIYGCTPEPISTVNDDRVNNKLNTGALVNADSYGAQADNKNASQFAIFRDNIAKAIRNDVWYPKYKAGTGLTYDNSPATRTYLVLDKNGTPNGDYFELQDVNGKVLLDGKSLQSKWHTVLSGQVNTFKWRSSWASEAGKPHKLNTIYGYKPTIASTIPASYGKDGGSNVDRTSVLDLLCLTKYNTIEMSKPIVVNGPKELTNETFSQFQNSVYSYYAVNFVKSSAE